jgi:hypothetical protein
MADLTYDEKKELCDIYNNSDIEALIYMKERLKDNEKLLSLCNRLTDLNENTKIGWGNEDYSGKELDEYYEGKWKLLNHFGIRNQNGDAVIEERKDIMDYRKEAEEKIAGMDGAEKDALYRALWAEYVRTDVEAVAEQHPEAENISIDNIVERYVYEGDYDCNLSYWDNINNLIEEDLLHSGISLHFEEKCHEEEERI